MGKGSRNRTIDRKAYDEAEYWKHLPTPCPDLEERVCEKIIKTKRLEKIVMKTEKEKLMNVFDKIGIKYNFDDDGQIVVGTKWHNITFYFNSYAQFDEIYVSKNGE